MSEPTSDALFGVDGTYEPEQVERGSWRDTPPELPPMYLPPVPDEQEMRKAIAAALGVDPDEEVDRESATPAPQQPPAPQAATPPAPASPAPTPHAPAPQAPTPEVPGPQVSTPQVPAPQPAASQAANPQPVNPQPMTPQPMTPQPAASQPMVTSPASPAPSRPRRPASLRYRPPMATAFRRPVPLAAIRRRTGHGTPGVTRQSTANTILGAGLSVAFVIVAVLLYSIITGIVESISRLFQ